MMDLWRGREPTKAGLTEETVAALINLVGNNSDLNGSGIRTSACHLTFHHVGRLAVFRGWTWAERPAGQTCSRAQQQQPADQREMRCSRWTVQRHQLRSNYKCTSDDILPSCSVLRDAVSRTTLDSDQQLLQFSGSFRPHNCFSTNAEDSDSSKRLMMSH